MTAIEHDCGHKHAAGAEHICAPSRIQICGLLLRRHFRRVTRRRWTWPDVRLSCTDNRWAWHGVAWHLSLLAPRLAPRDLVSLAHVRRLRPPLSGPATARSRGHLTLHDMKCSRRTRAGLPTQPGLRPDFAHGGHAGDRRDSHHQPNVRLWLIWR
jgi:hypothetical protein